MQCEISLNINKGLNNIGVKQHGAKIFTELGDVKNSIETMSSVVTLPTTLVIKKAAPLNRAKSYIFSNIVEPETAVVKATGVTEEEIETLKLAGANLYKGIANDYFSRFGRPLSNTPANSRVVVYAPKTQGNKALARDVIRISNTDVKEFRKIAAKEVGGIEVDDEGFALSEYALFNEGVEFLVLSALYRGFDVHIDSSKIDTRPIQAAITRYNKYLSTGTTRDATFITTSVASGGIKVNNFEEAFAVVDYKAPKVTPEINTSNPILNHLFSDLERTTVPIKKEPDLMSKLIIANRVVSVFKKFIPNLDTEIMTTQSIRLIYGETFSKQKGFIIGGKIVLNQDLFTPDTLFHEFAHYYLAWAKINSPEVYTDHMAKIGDTFSSSIPSYTAMYNNTGLQHTPEEILEEIFVDKIGIRAAELMNSHTANLSEDDVIEAVDDFSMSFLTALTGRGISYLSDIAFSTDSTIADILNIASNHSEYGATVSGVLGGPGAATAFKDFLITDMSSEQVFKALSTRGMIRQVRPGVIALYDGNYNRVDKNGTINASAEYFIGDTDTVSGVRKTNKLIEDLYPYLYKNKAFAEVKFSLGPNTMQSSADILRKATLGVELTADAANYEQDGVLLNRVTGFLSDSFTNKVDTEQFILNSIASEKMQTIISPYAEGTREDTEFKVAATKQYMESKDKDYQDAYARKAAIFEFKTSEGTFLHAIAEMYFRSINTTSRIDYPNSVPVEERSPTYFLEHIQNAISEGDSKKYREYFEKYIFNYMPIGTDPDADALRKLVDEVDKAMGIDRIASSVATKAFMRYLTETVLPVINKIPGPISILPELKLASKTLGLAGTLDLVVLDKFGRAHIFDYKTKEAGKERFWNYNETRGMPNPNMVGTMAPYKDNAMMKASIQTSIYKMMLAELGIETADVSIFYVENTLPTAISDRNRQAALANRSVPRYSPTRIKVKKVLDVTAELTDHFISIGRPPVGTGVIKPVQDIRDFVLKLTGGVDIDTATNVDTLSESIYDTAINSAAPGEGKRHAEVLASLMNTGKNAKGLKVWIAGIGARYLDPKLKGRAEHVAAIKEIIMKKEVFRKLEADLHATFDGLDRSRNTGKDTEGTKDTDKAMRALLSGADPTTHELVKLSSNSDLGLEFSGVNILKNKITGENRLIVLNREKSDDKIYPGGKDSANVLGKYLTTRAATIKSATVDWKGKWTNSKHNIRLIKAGLLIATQKSKNPDFKINVIVSNNGLSDGSHIPNVIDIPSVLTVTKIAIEAMRDSGDEVPAEVLKLLSDEKLFLASSYVTNPIDSLREFLNIAAGDYIRDTDLFTGKQAKHYKDNLKEILDSYTPSTDRHRLIGALHDFRNSIGFRLRDTRERYQDDLYMLTNEVIMFLEGHNYTTNPTEANFSDKYFFQVSKMPNKYGAAFNRSISKATEAIRADLIAYKNEHNKHIMAIAAVKNINLNFFGPAAITSSMKAIFKDLYATDNTSRAKGFILKTPDQVKTKEEKDYLNFLRDTFQKHADKISRGKVTIPYGWMPLMPKSASGKSTDSDFYENLRNSMDSFVKDKDDVADSRKTIEDIFNVESKFLAQLPGKDGLASEQFTEARRNILGVDIYGDDASNAPNRPLSNIEDNLENILDSFVADSLNVYHYKDVSEFGRAMFHNIKRYEELSKTDMSSLIDIVSIIQKRVVLHEKVDSNSKIGNITSKLATGAVVAGSIPQVLLESFTNPTITATNYLSDKIFGAVFKGQREYSAAAYAEARKIIATGSHDKIIEQLLGTYGILESDVSALMKSMNMTEKHMLFKSDTMMALNKVPLQLAQKTTFLAYMLHQGSFHAHSLDADGNLIYDEKKDKRFHFANQGLPADEYEYKKKFYEATKLQMAKEKGGLAGDPANYDKQVINKVYTGYEANHIKESIVELYSSLDDSSKSLITYYGHFAAIGKMRGWIFSKLGRYYMPAKSKDSNESAAKLTKVSTPDGGYTLEWVGTESEGILQTLWAATLQLQETRSVNLKPHQKKNMANLISDVLLFTVLTLGINFAYGLLDDENKKNPLIVLIHERALMGVKDLLVIMSIYEMTTGNGSMLIGYSIAARALRQAIQATVTTVKYTYDDETKTEDVSQELVKFIRSAFGPANSIALIIESINHGK